VLAATKGTLAGRGRYADSAAVNASRGAPAGTGIDVGVGRAARVSRGAEVATRRSAGAPRRKPIYP
jgi:hypothetical protein